MPIYKQAIIPQPHAAAVSPRENIDRTHVTRKQIRTHDGQQGNDPFDPLDYSILTLFCRYSIYLLYMFLDKFRIKTYMD